MKKLLCLPLICFGIVLEAGSETPVSSLLIDDFSGSSPRIGIEWEGFTDQVMGGRSEMSSRIVNDAGETRLLMQGDVTLQNNGGFIQMRLKLAQRPSSYDGSSYKGIRITVRGKAGDGYYLFLRTRQTRFPWKYYSAGFSVTDEWQTVDLEWDRFNPGNYGRMDSLKPDQLLSVAITAAFKEFSPVLEVRDISFF